MIECSQWTKTYEETIEEMSPKDKQIRKDYVTEYTKWFIDRKEDAKHSENKAEGEETQQTSEKASPTRQNCMDNRVHERNARS